MEELFSQSPSGRDDGGGQGRHGQHDDHWVASGLRRQLDLALALSAATDLRGALEQVLIAALAAEHFAGGAACLLVPSGDRLELAVHAGLSPEVVAAASSCCAASPFTHLALRGEALFGRCEDVLPALREGLPAGEGLRSIALLPISFAGAVIAALLLFSARGDDVAAEDRAAVTTLTALTGGALARLRAEEALRESEQQLRELALATADWVWEVDARGRYIACSGRIRTILGYEPEMLIGKRSFDFHVPGEAERLAPIFATMVERREGCTGLISRNLHRDGHEVVLSTSCLPILDEHGVLLGFRGATRTSPPSTRRGASWRRARHASARSWRTPATSCTR